MSNGMTFWTCKRCGAVVGVTAANEKRPENPQHDIFHAQIDKMLASLKSLATPNGFQEPRMGGQLRLGEGNRERHGLPG